MDLVDVKPSDTEEEEEEENTNVTIQFSDICFKRPLTISTNFFFLGFPY